MSCLKNSSRIYKATNVKIYLDPIEIKGSVIHASMRLIFCAKKTRPNVPVDPVGTKPSTIIDKLLEGFPYKMCDNYAAGCRVIKMSTGDFQKHQRNCPFRQVFCPVLSCKEKKVLSQDIIGHLTSIHNYDFENIRYSLIGKLSRICVEYIHFEFWNNKTWKYFYWLEENSEL